jgi:hypothetical protein
MSNVINLFDKKEEKKTKVPEKNDDITNMLNEAEKKNKENKERMIADRKKANESVTRSYRLKK